MAKEGEIDWMDSFCTISAEALFILVPFVVIGTVSFYKGEAHSIIYKPDWALAASIFLGQVLVKMVSGLLTAASSIGTGERLGCNLNYFRKHHCSFACPLSACSYVSSRCSAAFEGTCNCTGRIVFLWIDNFYSFRNAVTRCRNFCSRERRQEIGHT